MSDEDRMGKLQKGSYLRVLRKCALLSERELRRILDPRKLLGAKHEKRKVRIRKRTRQILPTAEPVLHCSPNTVRLVFT